MIKEKFENVKTHVKEHKTVYIAVTVGVLSAGFTGLVMRGRHEALVTDGAYGSKTIDTLITMRSLFSKQANVVNVVAREGRGHPGYIVFCEELDRYFNSQRSAAEGTGISPTLISKQIAGKIPDADGLHFERIAFAG